MSFHRPTRLQLAVHEAGHAYVYASLMMWEHPESMGVATNDHGEHHGWSARRTVLNREIQFRKLPVATLHEFEWAADVEMAILIAGPLAEFRHRHRSRLGAVLLCRQNADRFLMPDAFDTDGDFHTIRAIMADMSAADPEERLRSVIGVADLALAKNWPSVRRLSRHLLLRGQLDEAALQEWFSGHPPKHHHHSRSVSSPTDAAPIVD